MPQTHWEPVALGSSGSERRELAVYPESSFQKAWLMGGRGGEPRGHPKASLKCSCSAFSRATTVPFPLPRAPLKSTPYLGPFLQGQEGSFIGGISLGRKERISQKHNPACDPANDSHRPRGKKSILELLLGSRSPPDLLPRVELRRSD